MKAKKADIGYLRCKNCDRENFKVVIDMRRHNIRPGATKELIGTETILRFECAVCGCWPEYGGRLGST